MKKLRSLLLLSLLSSVFCPLASAIVPVGDSELTILDKLVLPAKADPGTPTALEIWISTTDADTLKYRSNGTTYSLLTTSAAAVIYQPLDATLTALAGVSTAPNKLIYATGSDTFSTTDLTAFGRAQLGISSLTSTALLLGGGSGAITAADITYSTATLTVPASFALTGAGSLAFNAGGSNQSITITPSGTGAVVVPSLINNTRAVEAGTSFYASGTGQTNFLKGFQQITADGADFFNIAQTGSAYAGAVASAGNNQTVIYAPNKYVFARGTLASQAFTFDGSTFAVLSGAIQGGANNLTITSGTGNSRTLTLQTTTSGGTATNALVLNATQDATITGDLTVSGGDLLVTGAMAASTTRITATGGRISSSGGGAAMIIESNGSNALSALVGSWTGGASNLTIIAGTGASRTLTFQTTTSGSTATTAFDISDTQAVRFPSTNTSGLQLYNTSDQTTNYERLETYWSSNVATIRTVKAGTGTDRALAIGTASTQAINISTGQFVLVGTSGTASSRFTVIDNYRDPTSGVSSATFTSSDSYAIGKGGSLQLAGAYTGTTLTTFGAIKGSKENATDANTAGQLQFYTRRAGAAMTLAMTIDSTQNAILVGNLTTLGGATFHTTSTALTDGAGASTATFTNAPSAGNPTKWIGINDNGTTRYIPAF